MKPAVALRHANLDAQINALAGALPVALVRSVRNA